MKKGQHMITIEDELLSTIANPACPPPVANTCAKAAAEISKFRACLEWVHDHTFDENVRGLIAKTIDLPACAEDPPTGSSGE